MVKYTNISTTAIIHKSSLETEVIQNGVSNQMNYWYVGKQWHFKYCTVTQSHKVKEYVQKNIINTSMCKAASQD